MATKRASYKDSLQLERALEELRYKLITSNDKYLNKRQLPDDLLVKFLRSRDYNVQRTVRSLKMYIEFVTNNSDLLRSPPQVKAVFNSNLIGPTDARDPVLFGQPGVWEPNEFDYDTYTAGVVLTMEALALNEDVQLVGIDYVIDLNGFTLKHLLKFGPAQAKRTANLIEKILPIKFKSIHLVNESRFTRLAFTIFKPFISSEFRALFKFHGSNYGSLQEAIDPRSLPEHLGGQAGRFSSKTWYKQLEKLEPSIKVLWSSMTIIK